MISICIGFLLSEAVLRVGTAEKMMRAAGLTGEDNVA
jgi:hypothetical protein